MPPNRIPPKYRHDGTSPLPLGMDWSPPPKQWAASSWLYIYPPGIRELLLYTQKKYNNPLIYITENEVDEFNNGSLTLKEALKDDMRIVCYQQHLQQLQQAIRSINSSSTYFHFSQV